MVPTPPTFWSTLPKPFSVLAPMEEVTDVVFRTIVGQAARPDVFFTEFTNCEALFSPGRASQIRKFAFTQAQRPIVGQIWGVEPEHYFRAAKLIEKLGLDGIDINMGCPDRSVVKHGAGAALIDNRAHAQAIIEATLKGAGSLPVSVKTRLGVRKIQTEDWIGFLLQFPLAAITVHGRTATELSKTSSHWDEIGKAVNLRNALNPSTRIIGNGDVQDWKDAVEKHQQFGVDGVMIGRGIFKNLWALDKTPTTHIQNAPTMLPMLLEHVRLFERTWGSTKNFNILKKFFSIYVRGWKGAAVLRAQLMTIRSAAEIEALLSQ